MVRFPFCVQRARTLVAAALVILALGVMHLPSVIAGTDRIFKNGFDLGTVTDCAVDADQDADGIRDEACLLAFVPPDPATVATPIDPTVATRFPAAYGFIYEGPSPIQRGVPTGTIQPYRIAVLRGRVNDHNASPLAGVLIRVLDHPEFGYTYTRQSGEFDLVVNGGGAVTIDYQKPGFLRAQRQAKGIPWHDFAILETVGLIPLDSAVTNISLGSGSPPQFGRGNVVNDVDGTRRASVFFPAGTTATMTLPDGSTQPLAQIGFRATEYTVGTEGKSRMPGTLPPSSGYTYAVELSVDQALSVGATKVNFNQPVALYVENFLNFPVGGIVPTGYYDFRLARWVASNNGRIVRIVSKGGGLADLDVNGLSVPATTEEYAALGITLSERERLANNYTVGQELWRSPISHFTPVDCNWPYGPAPGSQGPNTPDPDAANEKSDDPCLNSGSIIECENQVLGEAIPVAGTPYTLNYRSDRVKGRKADYLVNLTLSKEVPPVGVKRIELRYHMAGAEFVEELPATQQIPTHAIRWDGRDVFGRPIIGSTQLNVQVGYVYDAQYLTPAEQLQAFGQASADGVRLSGDPARSEATLWKSVNSRIGHLAVEAYGLGGWTVSSQHQFDTRSGALQLGYGKRLTDKSLPPVAREYAGQRYQSGTTIDGAPLLSARFGNLDSLAALPDGAALVSDPSQRRVFKLDTDGTVRRFLGNGQACASGCVVTGAGAIATAFGIGQPSKIAVAPNGDVFVVAGQFFDQVFRVANGRVTSAWSSGAWIRGLAIGADGTLYVANQNIITAVAPPFANPSAPGARVAGCITCGPQNAVEGGPALNAALRVDDLRVGPDGSLFTSEHDGFSSSMIRRVAPDGTISRIAGKNPYFCQGPCVGYTGDGGPATAATLHTPKGVAFGADGSFYIVESLNESVRRVAADGIISTIVGRPFSTACSNVPTPVGCENGSPALGFRLGASPQSIAAMPNGDLLILSYGDYVIYRTHPVVQVGGGVAITAGAPQGAAAYDFDVDGRHLRTRDSATGAVQVTLEYNAMGLLSGLLDAHGNRTVIERMPSGAPAAVVAQDGQRTMLTLDANGYLATVANPLGDTYAMTYTADGLLETFRDPKQQSSTIVYDAEGRLSLDSNAEQGLWDLDRTDLTDGYQVLLASAEGRIASHTVRARAAGGIERATLAASGDVSTRTLTADGSDSVQSADGSRAQVDKRPDPRFGMMAPIADFEITLPSALKFVSTARRIVAPSNPALPLSSLDETRTVNGRNYRRQYNGATRRFTLTSPQGRTQTLTLDAKGLPITLAVPGLASAAVGYDSRGRLIEIAAGSGATRRATTFGYDSFGFVDTLDDAEAHTTLLNNDAIGRTTSQTLPDLRQIGFGYDRNGNLVGLTPPGRAEHGLGYNGVDRMTRYTPPAVAGVANPATLYAYNLDRQLDNVVRPDGRVIDPNYNASSGRLDSVSTPHGNYAFIYRSGGMVQTISAPGGVSHSLTWDGPLPASHTLNGPIAGTVSYVYDANFWLDRLTVQDRTVDYGFDSDGLLTSAAVSGSPTLTLTPHAQYGLLTGTTLGVVSDAWTYNEFADITQYVARESGAARYQTNFVRDKLGRVTQKTEAVLGSTHVYLYAYDATGRLDTVTTDGVLSADYGYDSNGNRNALSGATAAIADGCFDGSASFSASYDAQDRMSSYGACTYTYGANGELSEKRQVLGGANPDAVTTYDYDVFGNLRSATLPDATTIEYVIDGRNRRIGKKVDGTLVQGFLYVNQLEPIAELDGSGALVSTFIYADRAHVPAFMIKGTNTYRIIADQLGSIRLVIDVATGAIAQRLDYDEFGNVLLDTAPGFQPFGYAGGVYDRDTGLTRFGARDYDAETGRWTAKDPSRFGGRDANLYRYAYGDPINYIDTSGNLAFLPWLAWIGAGMVADWVIDAYLAPAIHDWLIANYGCSSPESVAAIIDALGTAGALWDALSMLRGNVGKIDDVLSRAVNRRPTPTLRREWEKLNEKPWPKTADGKNHHAHHKEPLADGGVDDATNIEPLDAAAHRQLHKDNGDFSRWGSRR